MEENLQKRVGFGPRLGLLIDAVFITIIVFVMHFSLARLEQELVLRLDIVTADADAAAAGGGIMGAFWVLLSVLMGFWLYLIKPITGASLGR